MNRLFLILIVFITIPSAYAALYGEGTYSREVYSVGESTSGGSLPVCGNGACETGETCSSCSSDCGSCAAPGSPGGGGGGGGSSLITTNQSYVCSTDSECKSGQYCSSNKCYNAQCFDDSVCDTEDGETCLNHKCVKLFDVEIKDFESPVKLGDFFDFTYLIKGMADISGDVIINFFVENNNIVATSGQDTIYLGSFEEKTKTTKLFLPSTISSGTYTFRVEVTYGSYTAKSHRTIEIVVGKDGTAEIILVPETNLGGYIVFAFITLVILLVLYLSSSRKKKNGHSSDSILYPAQFKSSLELRWNRILNRRNDRIKKN